MVDNTKQFRDILQKALEQIRNMSPEEFEKTYIDLGYKPVRKDQPVTRPRLVVGDSVIGELRGNMARERGIIDIISRQPRGTLIVNFRPLNPKGTNPTFQIDIHGGVIINPQRYTRGYCGSIITAGTLVAASIEGHGLVTAMVTDVSPDGTIAIKYSNHWEPSMPKERCSRVNPDMARVTGKEVQW